jgi:hypothetical protein
MIRVRQPPTLLNTYPKLADLLRVGIWSVLASRGGGGLLCALSLASDPSFMGGCSSNTSSGGWVVIVPGCSSPDMPISEENMETNPLRNMTSAVCTTHPKQAIATLLERQCARHLDSNAVLEIIPHNTFPLLGSATWRCSIHRFINMLVP